MPVVGSYDTYISEIMTLTYHIESTKSKEICLNYLQVMIMRHKHGRDQYEKNTQLIAKNQNSLCPLLDEIHA